MKDLQYGPLSDFYGSLLTEKQREWVHLYYDEDLNLSEIAELNGVSRQAVKDTLSRTEALLLTYENQLGMFRKTNALRALAKELPPELADRLNAILDDETLSEGEQ